jgi:hypothetical protein
VSARADRLQVLEREIASQRKRVERIVDEMLDTPKGLERTPRRPSDSGAPRTCCDASSSSTPSKPRLIG